MTNCLGQLASEFEERPVEAVMLPLTLPWVQENLDRYNETWLARLIVELFTEIIKSKKSKFQTCVSL